MSTMITGGSNFPVRSNQKKSDSANNALEDLVKYSEFTYNKIKSKLLGTEVIKTSDTDAVQKLETKLAKLEEAQEKMKSANKIIKSKKFSDENKIKSLQEDLGFSEQQAKELVSPPPEWRTKPGFASYSLTNNNAKIKSTKARLEKVKMFKEKAKTQDKTENKKFNGGEIVENYEQDRIQLVFEEKPSEETRTLFKKNGFRWSPRNSAWQRQLNDNGRRAVEGIVQKLAEKEIDDLTSPKPDNDVKMREAFIDILPVLSGIEKGVVWGLDKVNKGANVVSYPAIKGLSLTNKFFSEHITGKLDDTFIDKFARKYLLASMNGLGLLTQKQEKDFVKHYSKMRRDLSRANISAEKADELMKKAFEDVDLSQYTIQQVQNLGHAGITPKQLRKLKKKQKEAQRAFFNAITIRYLENPDAREEIQDKFPELAKEMDKVRDYIDMLSEEAMNKGIMLPSQFKKWEGKYLSRLYLIQNPDIAVSAEAGIKIGKIHKGRKIESIVDYIVANPTEADRLGVVLDPNMMVKITIAKHTKQYRHRRLL